MLSYRKAGVDIDKATEFKKKIKSLARKTFNKNVLSEIGNFGGLYALRGVRRPVLVSSTDSVGTKLKVARLMNKHTTVGADIVNHCINDILSLGARPIFFLDYIGYSDVENRILIDVVSGLAKACRSAGCALIGGETAQLPGFYAKGEYDLVGCIIGIVERGKILDGSKIRAGDLLVGLSSTGLHTNGYSLARKIFFDRLGWKPNRYLPELKTTIGQALLRTHRSYLPVVRPVLPRVTGVAHITGGGFDDNLGRLLEAGLGCVIEKKSWQVPALFRLIQRYGTVADEEMFKVFNMGVGMVLFVNARAVGGVIKKLGEGVVIGKVVRSKTKVEIV